MAWGAPTPNPRPRAPSYGPLMECDCGYVCRGADVDELIEDARRHALDAHSIEVTADQIRGLVGRDLLREHP